MLFKQRQKHEHTGLAWSDCPVSELFPIPKNNSLMFSSRHYYLLHNILWINIYNINIYNININIYMQWIKPFYSMVNRKSSTPAIAANKIDLVDSFICFSFQFSTSLRDQWKQHGLWSTDHDWDWNLKYIDEKFLLVKKKSFFRLFLRQYNNIPKISNIWWVGVHCWTLLWKITFFRTQTWRTMIIPTCLIRLLSLQVPSPKKLRRLIFIDFIQPLSDKACHKLK